VAAACVNASLSILPLTLFLLVIPLGSEEKTELRDRRGRVAGASHVNLRSGPGISHPPITILNNGETVKVEKLEGSWYRVSLPQGVSGYIYAEFLQFFNGEPSEGTQVTLSQQGIDVSSEETLQERVPEAPQVTLSQQGIDLSSEETLQERLPEAPQVTLSQQGIDLSSEETLQERLPEAPQVAAAIKPEYAKESLPTTEPGNREETPAQLHVETEISPTPSQETEIPTGNPIRANQSVYTSLWNFTRWILVPLCIFVLGWIVGGNYYLRRDRIERTKLRF